MLLTLLLAQSAFACPTIATGTTVPLSFDTAQVAIVRQNGITTFSVSVNPMGDPQAFALVLPVPKVLTQDEVKTLDPTIFARLDGYTAPRHVADAGCSNYASGGSSDTATDADDGGVGENNGSVEVEATYLVGDYEVVILSAEESLGLETWLDKNGYHLPDGAEERLGEYIDAGSFFLAAKVAPGADLADGSSLAPLQVRYESDGFTIPLRLATLNSPGEQDMVIYAITETDASDGGRVGIANYPEFTVPDKCVWQDFDGNRDFLTFYDSAFTEEWAATKSVGWTVEYAGEFNDCSPCSGTSITEEDVAALGFTGNAYDHHLTRIHARYTPEQAQQDLVLYGSGMYEPKVTSFADDNPGNECVEQVCGMYTDGDDEAPVKKIAATDACGGCTTGPGGAVGGVGALVGLAMRRRAIRG